MKIKVLPSNNGQYFFRIVSSNGNTLAHSETYRNYADAYSAAALVKAQAGTATIG